MIVKTFETGEFWFLPFLKDAKGFVIDAAMQYLVYKVPNYKNWITDDQLSNPGSCSDFLEAHDPSLDWKTGGHPLHGGSFEIIGVAFRLEKSKVDIVGYYNIITTLREEKLQPRETIILKRLN